MIPTDDKIKEFFANIDFRSPVAITILMVLISITLAAILYIFVLSMVG